MKRFRTITGSLSWRGKGLHSGGECSVEIRPSKRPGITFSHKGDETPLEALQADGSGRGTTVTFPDGRRVMTVEHLLGVLSGLGLWCVSISLEGPEIPALDGSGRVLAEEIAKVAFDSPQDGPEPFVVNFPVAVEDPERGAFVACFPSRETRVTAVIRHDGTSPSVQAAEYGHAIGDFAREIASARTFVLESEIEGVLSRGLGRGGSWDNTLVLGSDGPLQAPRFPDEAPRHKILDLFGDLALLGRPVTGQFFSYKGGHALNLRLMERLRRLAGTN
jgi:UDP-3-O-[3-hydroxymyristoyl] N-acetylglucosamine deacetylase